MKKTFLEVIAEIKEGEIWVNKYQRVSTIKGKNGIAMLKGGEFFNANNSTCIDVNAIYELERKKVSFSEAFKAYEKGKEIESCKCLARYKRIEKEDCWYNDIGGEWIENADFGIDEIRGGWYING